MESLFTNSIGTPTLWIAFLLLIAVLVSLDLGLFQRRAHVPTIREAALMSVIWIGLALLFNVWVYFQFGRQAALEYLGGYIVEKALSVDNLFVFIVIFKYFVVPPLYQRRVLLYGILGAVIMRGVFIVLGAALIQTFHWVLYLFGVLLVITGIKLLREDSSEIKIEKNPLIRLARKYLPLSASYEGSHFTVRQYGKLVFTPLLLVLLAIEATDVVFAIDSIPAIFAITQDPFLVFTSNIFAVLGLRALFFLISGAMVRFTYLRVGLAFILAFIGGKMLIMDLVKIPIGVSLSVIAAALVLSISWEKIRQIAGLPPIEKATATTVPSVDSDISRTA